MKTSGFYFVIKKMDVRSRGRNKRREEKKSANERIIMSPLSNICKPVTARGNGANELLFDLPWPYHSLILSYQPMGAMGGPSV